MSEILVQASKPEATLVDNRFLSVYMPKAPENATKVYLFGLMIASGAAVSMKELDLPDAMIEQSFEYWSDLGLVEILSRNPLTVKYLSLDENTRKAPPLPERAYTELVEKITRALDGRTLAAGDLRRVYDWIEVYGLEEDTVELLVTHCVQAAGSAQLRFAYLETVARAWSDAGVKTVEDAKNHIQQYLLKQGGASKLKKLWNQPGLPTQPEIELYEKWTSGWGFTMEAILLVAAQTTGVRNPNFKYLDAVLEDYKKRGLVDIQALSGYLKEKEDRSVHVRQQAELILKRIGIKRAPTREDKDQVEIWLYDYHTPMELLFYAAELSATKSMPFSYMKKLVADWRAQGITTLAKAREMVGQTGEGKTSESKKKLSGWDFPQREYTEEELDQIIINSMGELGL